ncbi:hypothetical protein KFL82_004689 [Salmonella enterica]|nr:hypothetical protein [Salmonella enterica]EIB2628749.1 hypothetical protein [Salmonella enterica]
MKLNLSDIKFSGFGYVSSTVEVEVGPYPHLLSMCTMHVSVPLVEGKTLEQYKEELLAQARERIASMYKEIVCGGKHQIRVVNKNGKLSVAGVEYYSGADYPEKRVASTEEHLSSSLGAGTLNATYEVGKKAAEDYINGREEHPDDRVELSVYRITNRGNSPYVIVSLSCVNELNWEILSLDIEVERDDRKGIPYYESVAINKARQIIKRISAQL